MARRCRLVERKLVVPAPGGVRRRARAAVLRDDERVALHLHTLAEVGELQRGRLRRASIPVPEGADLTDSLEWVNKFIDQK